MRIKKLQVINFRNYEKLYVDLDPNINIFLGNNAQGKTNLLESIFYFAGGRSNRTFQDRELIRLNQSFFNIAAEVETLNGSYHLKIAYTQEGKKKIKINGLEKKSMPKDFKAVIFSPDDLNLAKGSPSGRRDFLDREIGQISSIYSKTLRDYTKILRQRNKVLKLSMDWKKTEEDLSLWDEQFIHYGSLVLKKRLETIQKLSILSRLVYRRLTDNKENLHLNYVSGLEINHDSELEHIKSMFREQLNILKKDELKNRVSLLGPHRDDLKILIDNQPAKNYASQGQQRTCVLALKLSIMEIIKGKRGEYPVLLLDDVFSELDQSRRIFLVQEIKKGIQTFITGTREEEILNNLNVPAKIFLIKQGNVRVL